MPSCHVNLLALSRYAKQCGKKLVEFFNLMSRKGHRVMSFLCDRGKGHQVMV